jgi:hypothetical protein
VFNREYVGGNFEIGDNKLFDEVQNEEYNSWQSAKISRFGYCITGNE